MDGVHIQVAITMPADWKEAAQKLAAKRGVSFSELIRDLIADALPAKERKQLSEPSKRGRPEKPNE